MLPSHDTRFEEAIEKEGKTLEKKFIKEHGHKAKEVLAAARKVAKKMKEKYGTHNKRTGETFDDVDYRIFKRAEKDEKMLKKFPRY